MYSHIYLPTRNNLTWLKECIKTLRWYTNLDDNKLKVFNSASTDGTEEFLHENRIDAFNSMVNISGEKSVNIAIEQSLQDKKMKYFCLIHDDMIFTKDWLKTMIEEMENIKDCFLLGCLTIIHKKAYMIPDERRTLITQQLKENFTGRAGSPLWLIKRECLEKIGLIDEKFAFGECSDNDYFKRIEEQGKKFLLTHKTAIFHGEKITRCNLEGHDEYVKKSKEYFSQKYNGENPLKWGDKVIKYVRVDDEDWQVWGAK